MSLPRATPVAVPRAVPVAPPGLSTPLFGPFVYFAESAKLRAAHEADRVRALAARARKNRALPVARPVRN